MDPSARYSIPVPLRFSVPPLVELPWGAHSVPLLLAPLRDERQKLIERVKQAYGVEYVLLTDSARSAYAALVRGMGLTGEIILTSFMHTPTAVLLSNLGLELAFCDIGEDFCATRDSLDAATSDATRAVMVTQMFGRVAEMDLIEAWAKERDLLLLSNLVHMPDGVDLEGRPLASYGDVAFLSFNMDKPLHSIYGGALLTNSREIYEAARGIELKAKPTKAVAKLLGRYLALYRYKGLLNPANYVAENLKGTYLNRDDVDLTFESFSGSKYQGFSPSGIHPWQARFAYRLLEISPEMKARRRRNAELAIESLGEVPRVSVPRDDERGNAFQYFPLTLDPSLSRHKLGVEMARRGMECKWRYYPLHKQSKFAAVRCGDLTTTERLWSHYLLIPVLCGDARDVEKVTDAIRDIVTSGAADETAR